MKKTALAIAIGAVFSGFSGSLLATEQQSTDEQRSEANSVTQQDAQQTQGSTQSQQEETQIRVEEEPADVEVEQGAPDVNVDQEPPEVTIEQPKPEVNITQPEPNVVIDQAEPNVSVEEQGEPEVNVERSGEPDVSVEQTEMESDEQEQERQREQDEQQQSQSTQGGQDLMAMTASDFEGATVHNEDGQEIGEVQHIALDTRDNSLYAIVSVGGFWGIGSSDIALPMDEMERQGDRLVMQTTRDEDEIEDSANEYDEANYREVEGNTTLSEADQS
ncbi:DUF6470 family protein [Halomonas sp. Bachu 37]|uniref:DUF6470 family protein n=1 Tax=Halomonas kashgarensis TaxID=3084920 RepID=UPI003217BEF9